MLEFSMRERERERESKGAFTLAEVLITLAVVGIVAASTIPAVVTKLTRQEYVTKLQKAHNTLVNVYKAAEVEHGPAQFWRGGPTQDAYFIKYLKPQFDIMADCGLISNNTTNACMAIPDDYKDLGGGAFTGTLTFVNGWMHSKIVTPDGITFSFYTESGDLFAGKNATADLVAVDVNGKKPPNQVGRDLFFFHSWRETDAEARANGREANPVRGVKPAGANVDYATQIIPTAAPGCSASSTSSGQRGFYCAAKVLTEGAMNY
ncbi:hypothetical protein tpqmel_0065 [Candidatus Gastranaerophilus sp. (ex Termes propinquus)]|nr:hypothetical protein tpqmel_0065 [Candidatus Gastranaerophilus sp. (ex Termes propinquus)]